MVRDLITFGPLRRLTFGLVPLLCLTISQNIAIADVLDIPEPPQAVAGLPETGMTMDQIVAQFGEPDRKHRTVSNPGTNHRPPINRWDYPTFSVIFERDKVIHTVSPQHPPKVSAPSS